MSAVQQRPGSGSVVTPHRFRLFRHSDPSGVSGTGTVAWGTVYPNGKVSLAWCGARPSINIYESLADVEAIHGHDGCTEIVMWDGPATDESITTLHRPVRRRRLTAVPPQLADL